LLIDKTVKVDERSAQPRPVAGDAQWFVLWTRSHCEQLVHDQLIGKGFNSFLPTMKTWSKRQGLKRVIAVPMFPGYVFVNHAIDKFSYVEILKARGVVGILGERWDRLCSVLDSEVEAIQRVAGSSLPFLPHPYLREGQQVRITAGALEGVEGILIHMKPNKGLLVLSVELLQRSVAVEVDCTHVVPLGPCLGAPPRPSLHHASAFHAQ
jgi:transcription antitermination factor NusG